MKKKPIDELVHFSYVDGMLDRQKVEQIADLLKRHDLKEYITALKKYERQNTIIVSLPSMPEEKEQKKLQTLFPKKRIIYIIDPSLLMGMKVVDNDIIYNETLKNKLEELVDHLSHYD